MPVAHRTWWRKLLAFAGPGYLVAVGYMDPGNWATDLAGGSKDLERAVFLSVFKQPGTNVVEVCDAVKAMIPKYEFLKEVRWRGLMMGIEFGSPKSLTLKAAWSTIHAMDKSLFPQVAIMPLLDKHHIITQVAGHQVDVVKLLPPLVITEADAQWFLTGFEDVLAQMHKFPGPAWDVLTDIGRMVVTNRAR